MPEISKNHSVEILSIGSEILLGNILNTNAKWLAEELAKIGLQHFRQSVIGDNFKRLKSIILEASERNSILITTGGLGPTPDDLTTETISCAFNTPLIKSNEVAQDIQNKLRLSDHKSLSINNKQALYPKGAEIIPNSTGTAPGIIWSPKPGFTIITFPGVPSEMKQMWTDVALPWLKKNTGLQETIKSKILKFTGISESSLAEKVSDLLHNSNPTISPYAELGEVKLRITAQANNVQQANKLISPIECELIKRGGVNYFGSNNETLPSVVIQLLKDLGQTVSVAESCTGGSLGAAFTAIPGSSEVFLGGIIAYNNLIKQKLLEISPPILEEYGAVSSNVVKAMAEAVRKKFNSDWGLAISGIAGPTGASKNKPIGLVQFGISGKNILESSQENFSPQRGRRAIQELSVMRSLDILRLFLLRES